MSQIQVGKEYDVFHHRKGRFRIRVEELDGDYIVGEITQGTAKYLGEPDRGPGDGIYVNTKLRWIHITPVGE